MEQRKCIICGEYFVPILSSQKVCSGKCRIENNRRIKKIYEIRNRDARNRKRRERRSDLYEQRHCSFCGALIGYRRKDKKFCNYLCRQRMYRFLRKGEKVPALLNANERIALLDRLNENVSKDRSFHTNTKNKASHIKLTETQWQERNSIGWKHEVERVMELPYSERYEFSRKWNEDERKYAKKIELRKIREDQNSWHFD